MRTALPPGRTGDEGNFAVESSHETSCRVGGSCPTVTPQRNVVNAVTARYRSDDRCVNIKQYSPHVSSEFRPVACGYCLAHQAAHPPTQVVRLRARSRH